MDKELALRITGLIFLVFGIGAILNSIFILKKISILFWFCHPALIILGIGFLIKSRNLIQSQLNILTIPLTIWTLDFLQFLITKDSIFKISEYFFQQGEIISKIITSQHLFILPLSFIMLRYIKGNSKKAGIISIIMILIIFFISRLFGPEKNINMSFKFLEISITFYPLIWIIVTLISAFLINILINKIYSKNFKL